MTTPVLNAVCLAIDGLRASALGAYGNTWFDTPDLDRLAARALTVDFTLSDARGVESTYQTLWQGTHGLRPPTASPNRAGLIQGCADHGYHTRLVTDEPAVAELARAAAFHDVVRLRPARSPATVQRLEQTQMARVLAEAAGQMEDLATRREPFLLWVHSRGMTAPWDAPLVLRQQLADSEDPLPGENADVPCLVLEADHDPDHLFALACGYAAQVMALDASVGALCRCLDECPAVETTVLTLVGTAGFPLGEHAIVGAAVPCLYSESVHVPWLLRIPGHNEATGRTSALAHLTDLPATLAHVLRADGSWDASDGQSLRVVGSDPLQPGREHLCVADKAGGLGLRTPDWYYLKAANNHRRLFVKPDDRWEVNDVSDRCRDVVDTLDGVLEAEAARLRRTLP